jgi:hypothetical protein
VTTPRRITVPERRARAGARHLLAPSARAGSAEEVAEALVALHATDAATVYLSVLARLRDPLVTEVERALYEEHTLARMHGMRQTLFVFPAALAAAIQASTTRDLWVKERAGLLKSAADAGLPADWLGLLEEQTVAAVAARGPITGAELGKAVPGLKDQVLYGKGTKWEAWQTATARVMRTLGFDGRVVRDRPVGSWTSSQFRWIAGSGHAEVAPDEARAELVRRWLAAFGPGTEADLKWWTGWTATNVRKALKAVAAEPVELDGGATGFVLPGDLDPVPAPEPWAALLPGLDPTPMGWQDRGWYLPEAHRAELFDRSGNIGPTVWWNGEIVGGWAQRADGEVVTRLFADLGADAVKAVAVEAERIGAAIGVARVTPRFRTPLERELAG